MLGILPRPRNVGRWHVSVWLITYRVFEEY